MKQTLTIIGLILLLGVAGCIESQDPVTGEKTYKLSPTAIEKGEAASEGTATLLGILSLFYPALIPATTAVAAGLATWKKMKPQITAAQTKAKMFHTAGQVTALGLVEYKKSNPKDWELIATYLDEAKEDFVKKEDRLRIENLIRGFIGKPPKA